MTDGDKRTLVQMTQLTLWGPATEGPAGERLDPKLEPRTANLVPREPAAPSSSPSRGPKDAAAPDAEALFRRVFGRLRFRRPELIFRVVYFPYAGLRSTIRLQDETRAEVMITDVLAGAPPIVIEALAEILLTRLFGRQPSREARECYKAYVMAPGVRQRIDEARRARGFKLLLSARGRHFDLEAVFDGLNSRFFQGRLARPRIGWSPQRSRTMLGHYDASHHTITVTRWFDAPSVPRCLVEYVVFHEMLHIRYPIGRNGHRRVVHSKEFLRAERKFPMYEEARRALKHMTLSDRGMDDM